jgi:hypothetical protein
VRFFAKISPVILKKRNAQRQIGEIFLHWFARQFGHKWLRVEKHVQSRFSSAEPYGRLRVESLLDDYNLDYKLSLWADQENKFLMLSTMMMQHHWYCILQSSFLHHSFLHHSFLHHSFLHHSFSHLRYSPYFGSC